MAEERRHISQLNLLTPAAGDLLMVQDISEGTGAGADAYKRLPLSEVGLPALANTWTAQQTFNAAIQAQAGIAAARFYTTAANINDDDVFVLPTDGSGFVFICPTRNTEYMGAAAFRAMSSLEGPEIARIFGAPTNFDVATGVLTGTTGVDGRVTVSAAADGNLYIENRRGFQRTFRIILLG